MYTNVHQYVEFTPIYINEHDQCKSMYIDVYQCKPMTKYMSVILMVYVTLKNLIKIYR